MSILCMIMGHRWRWMRCERCDAWRTTPMAVAMPLPTRRVHVLKCWPRYLASVIIGDKPFEVRRNDRDYHVGDHLILCGWDPMDQKHTGVRATCIITYVLPGGSFGIDLEYCVLGIKPLHHSNAIRHDRGAVE